MKALLELKYIDADDIITTSSICGEFTEGTGTSCTGDDDC